MATHEATVTSEARHLVMPHVVILGAGVIGLQSAVNLLEAGHTVTVVATHFPGDESPDYTSPWAGAHWRTHATSQPADVDQRRWDIATYEHWLPLLSRPMTISQRAALPIKLYSSLNYWDADARPTDTIWWAPHVKDFASIPPVNVTGASIGSIKGQERIKDAAKFTSVALDAPRYLLTLRDQVLDKGGKFVRYTLPTPSSPSDASTALFGASLDAAARTVRRITGKEVDVFVNATGLGARKLCGDESVYPIKGQTVLVKGEAEAIRTRKGKGYIAYVIPRPGSGTSILGGTNEESIWDGSVEDEVTERILERCRTLAPELLTCATGGKGRGKFEVVSVQIGFRPGRRGGARMEREVVNGAGGKRWNVVHAYGHAGAGYQNSIGVAGDVVKCVSLRPSQEIGASASGPKL